MTTMIQLMKTRTRLQRSIQQQSGMSLIEMMIAMFVLAVGLQGSMIMIVLGMQTDSRNKTDTTATILDQEVIEKFATLKNYPRPVSVNIYDCALGNGNANMHNASLGAGASPTGGGATLYTSASAPNVMQVGDIDWSQATPVLATSTVSGYAMRYQSCSGEIYEVRWNVMLLSVNSRISQLVVSTRPVAAVAADAGAGTTRAILYARPVTLRTLIEN